MDGGNRLQVVVPPPPSMIKFRSSQTWDTGTLSVQQALQYTPLATSVLPAHDRVPFPILCRPRESAKLTSSHERKTMVNKLANYPAARVKETLDGLLNPYSLAEIKFQKAPTKTSSLKHATRIGQDDAEYRLSSTAKMIYDRSRIDYRYPSEPSPINQSQSMPDPRTVPTLPVDIPSKPVFEKQVKAEFKVVPATVTPDLKDTKSIQPIMVQISQPSPDFRREDYVEVPETNKRRKLSSDGINIETTLHIRSHKEASDAATLHFQDILMELFEAEDQVNAGSTSAHPEFFDSAPDGDESEPRLTLKMLEKLQTSLKKLVSLNRLSDISAEHLRRLQRLCEPAIEHAQTTNLRLPSDPSHEDQEEWQQRLKTFEASIASSFVCLLTILGCPEEENLLSTDVRTWIPNTLVNLFENCLIPAIESRADGQDAELFAAVTRNKEPVKRLLESGKRLLDTMTTVCTDVKGTNESVNPVEFLCAKLIFVQNATNDKGSCLGIHSYEKARKTAMSCLARIYARFPSERQTILDEILSSLDKLPPNSKSAHKYRISDKNSIQLITALFMQLVQTTSLQLTNSEKESKRSLLPDNASRLGGSDVEDDEDARAIDHANQHIDVKKGPVTSLKARAALLFDGSSTSANDIVSYLVTRASKTTKTGDSPYRGVLDRFVEDLVSVLPSPEWPSAQVMLHMLALRMNSLARNDKTALTKNMALDALGYMGKGIAALKASIPTLSAVLGKEDLHLSSTSKQLCQLARDHEEMGRLPADALISLDGPFAAVARHMSTDLGQSLHSRSACGFFLAQYAKLVVSNTAVDQLDETDIETDSVRVADWLLAVIPAVGTGSIDVSHFDAVTPAEAELAYAMCVLNLWFCRGLQEIVNTLTASFSSDQAQVRSQSLRGLDTMLKADSSLLNYSNIIKSIFKCASDESPMVRTSALKLIAEFIIFKPQLQQKSISLLLMCASDPKVSVQKHALSYLKDVYNRDDGSDTYKDLRAVISGTFLLRTKDHEDSIADLAQRTLGEIWIDTNIAKLSDPVESKRKIVIEQLTVEIVRSVGRNPDTLSPLLQKFLKKSLNTDTKSSNKIRNLCSMVVEELFEKTISGAEDQGPLHTLTAFAAIEAELVPPDRLAKLRTYLGNLKNDDDMFVFRSVISIFRSVLPSLSASHNTLLLDIQTDLINSVGKLGRRSEMDPVMMCLSTIEDVLQNPRKLVVMTVSVLSRINALHAKPLSVARLLNIAGAISRYLDLDGQTQTFGILLKGEVRGGSVSNHLGQVFLDHTKESLDLRVRMSALESLGSLCQASPIQFNKPEICKVFFSVLRDDNAGVMQGQMELRIVVLRLFDELYASRAQSKEESEKSMEDDVQQELGKLGGDNKTREGDSAVVTVTRDVVTHVLNLALRTEGECAFLAARTLSHISQEGLIHPMQSTAAFVALTTSPDLRVATIAHTALQLLHQTHESVCEREYMDSVIQAFQYQKKVIHDPTGARPEEYIAKLAKCFEIINTSSASYVRKFLLGLVTRVSNDTAARNKRAYTTDHVLFARFIMQNLAFFEYTRLDDLLHTILQLELAYGKSGGEVMQQLEAHHLPKAELDWKDINQIEVKEEYIEDGQIAPTKTDSTIIQQLAPIAATLTLLMETRAYLKRQYGIGRDTRAAIEHYKQSKDKSKGPTKVYGITGERIWNKTNDIVDSLTDNTRMAACCTNFMSLMNADEDVDVAGDDPANNAYTGHLVPADNDTKAATPNGRKRKGSASVGNTPMKKPRSRPRKELRRSASFSSTEEPDADYGE